MSDITPRIYVACLSSYNAGILHGVWIDCENKSADEIHEEIQAMLAKSTQFPAEEYAIHDYEGFPNLSEYESIDDVADMAEFISEHGEMAVALLDHHCGDLETAKDHADDHFCGEYASMADYCEESCEDLIGKVPDMLKYYIDYDSMARDWLIYGYYTIDTDGGNVWVFHD